LGSREAAARASVDTLRRRRLASETHRRGRSGNAWPSPQRFSCRQARPHARYLSLPSVPRSPALRAIALRTVNVPASVDDDNFRRRAVSDGVYKVLRIHKVVRVHRHHSPHTHKPGQRRTSMDVADAKSAVSSAVAGTRAKSRPGRICRKYSGDDEDDSTAAADATATASENRRWGMSKRARVKKGKKLSGTGAVQGPPDFFLI